MAGAAASVPVATGLPNAFQGYYEGGSQQYLDLVSWRALGWDKTSVVAAIEIAFDADTLELTMASRTPLPPVNAVNHIQSDMLGQATGATRAAGPIADPGAARALRADPRRFND